MVEVAAHLNDHVLPPLPIRQWVLSVPRRIRPFFHHDPAVAGAVLRILLRAIRTALRHGSPGAGPDAQLGAVSFLQRFGAALNRTERGRKGVWISFYGAGCQDAPPRPAGDASHTPLLRCRTSRLAPLTRFSRVFS
jgi:hypothetical protein